MSDNWLQIHRWELAVGRPKIEGLRAKTDLGRIYVRPKIEKHHDKILDISRAYPQFLSKGPASSE